MRLNGETPISDCLVDDQSAGDLADVGASLVRTATFLSAGAERDPGGPQTVQLGYLIGAVQEGASETSGIHADLVRRHRGRLPLPEAAGHELVRPRLRAGLRGGPQRRLRPRR